MVVNTKLDAVSCSNWAAGDVPSFPVGIGGAATVANRQSVSEATAQTDLSTAAGAVQYRRYTYEYVNAAGEVQDRETLVGANFARYVEFPGQRLFKKTKFDVNGNPLTYQGIKVEF
jgi:hypothetical protein